MTERVSILAIGDVHLGAACSGVPEGMADRGVDPRELTPEAALARCVDLAVAERVDAVLFAGDVVESTNARFEAMVPLEESVRRLVDGGIEVIAVAGNHDVEALPRLAALIDGFTLLGAGGRWEARTIPKDQSPVVQVVGWSFGEERVRHSPAAELLKQPPALPSPPVPRIGLLHADLDASGGYYAPVRQAELDDTGYGAWLLGHIHKPSIEGLSATGTRPCGYLGSLVGLDFSETGPHGPWLVEVSREGGIACRQIPLAPLRWERVTVRVDGLEHADDVHDRLMSEAESLVRRLGEVGFLPRAIGLRVHLTGTAGCYDGLRRWIEGEAWRSMGRVVDGTGVFFCEVVDAMAPPLDLEAIASGDDPAALVAQRLLMLERDDDRSRILLAEARAELNGTAGELLWQPVQEHRHAADPLSDGALRDVLLRAGRAVLSAMIAGREQGDST